MRNLIKNLRELRNRPDSEQGFTLIEMIVVIGLLALLMTAAIGGQINLANVAKDFINKPTCTNQGKTAEKLCQLQQIAVGVKGTNEQMKLDYTMVPPGDVSPTLVWQVASVPGSVCIVGYDPNDSTSKFTHAKPFVYDSVSRERATGVGCGHYDEAGSYVWENDPTVPKPVYVQPVNAPKNVRAVGAQGASMNGTIDSFVEGEKLSVVMTRSYGDTPAAIVFDANYVCSNGPTTFTKTEQIYAPLTKGANASWTGLIVTYGGAGLDAPKCKPQTVSLTAKTGVNWTLGNTYNFTY